MRSSLLRIAGEQLQVDAPVGDAVAGQHIPGHGAHPDRSTDEPLVHGVGRQAGAQQRLQPVSVDPPTQRGGVCSGSSDNTWVISRRSA